MACRAIGQEVAAGAQFIQTQYCYGVPRLKTFMQQVEDIGLLGKVFILVGVGPLRSAKAADWMRTNVPAFIFRMQSSNAWLVPRSLRSKDAICALT